MINQNRVRQMSHLAMMESDMGKNIVAVCSYRKVDYVIVQILKGFFMGTVCYAALLLLWLCFLWDDLNEFFADAHYEEFAGKALLGYAAFMVFYLVICGVVASARYKKYRKRKYLYLKYLKRLDRSYVSEEKEDE